VGGLSGTLFQHAACARLISFSQALKQISLYVHTVRIPLSGKLRGKGFPTFASLWILDPSAKKKKKSRIVNIY
jgi:hypothetical protein